MNAFNCLSVDVASRMLDVFAKREAEVVSEADMAEADGSTARALEAAVMTATVVPSDAISTA